MEFYTKACDLKYPSACNNLGILYEDKKDYKKALELYAKACDLEHSGACYIWVFRIKRVKA
ncbi:tetratricopeptide repeat protein [Helicobacter rodentium]|uniref:tetratricopeptide repeat protein n=1 Tax=Helicobacter rodentium TaxID=59617 RepID=UPI003B599667